MSLDSRNDTPVKLASQKIALESLFDESDDDFLNFKPMKKTPQSSVKRRIIEKDDSPPPQVAQVAPRKEEPNECELENMFSSQEVVAVSISYPTKKIPPGLVIECIIYLNSRDQLTLSERF